jgi:hypothetical protein
MRTSTWWIVLGLFVACGAAQVYTIGGGVPVSNATQFMIAGLLSALAALLLPRRNHEKPTG